MDKQAQLVQFTAIRDCLAELDVLSQKPNQTKQDESRIKVLLAKVAALRSGYTHQELGRAEAIATADGAEQAHRIASDFAKADHAPLTPEQRAIAAAWQKLVLTGEHRDLGAGPVPAAGPAGSGSIPFFPQEFFYNLTAVLKVHSPLFDDTFCTVVRTTHGRPLQVGYIADTDNVAVKITEGTQTTESDPNTGGVVIFVDTYRTPLFKASRESVEDIEASFGVAEMASYFLGDRFARGAGRDLLLGNVSGTGQNNATPGLIPRLRTAGAVTVIAAGSATVTGGTETGANSIGGEDLARLFHSVNAVYRKSPKCAWLMHPNTLQRLAAITTKQGLAYNLVTWEKRDLPEGPTVKQACIFAKYVYQDPNMDFSHSGAYSVVFGDFSYWCTRIAQDASRVQVYTEAPGLVENGKFGLRLFGRAGGDLRFGSSLTSPATSPYTLVELPLVLLQRSSAS